MQREIAWRDDRRVARLLKAARLKVASACIEDINWRASRGLDRGLIATLAIVMLGLAASWDTAGGLFGHPQGWVGLTSSGMAVLGATFWLQSRI